MRAQVHDDKLVAGHESETIRARRELLSSDLERHFCNQVALILLPDVGGIPGTIDEPTQHVNIVGETDAGGVAHLHRRNLSAEKDLVGKELAGDLRGFKDSLLPCGWTRYRGGETHAQQCDQKRKYRQSGFATHKETPPFDCAEKFIIDVGGYSSCSGRSDRTGVGETRAPEKYLTASVPNWE